MFFPRPLSYFRQQGAGSRIEQIYLIIADADPKSQPQMKLPRNAPMKMQIKMYPL